MYNILFYEDEAGNKPVEIFMDKLDESASNNKRARNLRNVSLVIYGSCVLEIIVFYFSVGVAINLFYCTISQRQLKKHP